MEYRLKSFLSELSWKFTSFEDKETIFFPVENAVDYDKSRKKEIKKKLMSIGKYKSKLYNLLGLRIWIKSIYV
eukprot:snap_masked-scaffold_52-processed-gene-1.62-mRNA-1 protein AED:1.00 eAED:1.00 QI:0/-1/0/0/-1/1/1/0/72